MFTNDDWNEASVAEKPTFVDLPSGNYDVVLDKVTMREASTTKNGYELPPFVNYTFTVLSAGEYYGCLTQKEDGLWDKNCAAYVKRDIQMLGCVVPKNFNDIPLALQSAIGKTLNVTVKVTPRRDGKGDLRNIYLNRVTEIVVPPSLQKQREMNQISEENAQRLNKVAKKQDTFGGEYLGENEEIPF